MLKILVLTNSQKFLLKKLVLKILVLKILVLKHNPPKGWCFRLSRWDTKFTVQRRGAMGFSKCMAT